METRVFIEHLEEATKCALELAKEYCWNGISSEVVYEIVPNENDLSPHLNIEEQEKLKPLIQNPKSEYSKDEVVDQLVMKGKVPMWVNVSVVTSKKKKTVVQLICSRRYRDEIQGLFHMQEGYPPFHCVISLPPYFKEGEKFDINWNRRGIKFSLNRLIWRIIN